MYNDHKRRWVFAHMVDGHHPAADYSVSYEYPCVVDGAALAYCVMNAHQIRAARQDPRLTILGSLHSHEAVPNHVADHHQVHGVARGMRLHDMLLALSKLHSNFEPED